MRLDSLIDTVPIDINVGNIIIDDGGTYGDGANMAARAWVLRPSRGCFRLAAPGKDVSS